MKKNISASILSAIVSLIILNPLIIASANDKKTENLNMVILFKENKIDSQVEEIITKTGGKITREIQAIGGIEVECNPELIPEIKENDSVESISPSHIIKLKNNNFVNSNQYYKTEENSYYEDKNNSYYEDNGNSYYEDKGNSYYEDNSTGYYKDNNSSNFNEDDIFAGNLYERYQWDIKRVTDNGESFNIECGNHNVVVGIIDSGVDTDHSDLKENYLGGKNFVPQYFQDDDTETGNINDVEDRYGHGTEVAGQIAANGRIKGVAPQVGFKSYRVFNKYGETSASICSDAIISAVNDGNKVINLSFGTYYLDGECTWTDKDTGEKYNLGDNMADYALLERAIEYAVNNNVVVVAAAGNEGFDCSDNKKLAEYFNDRYGEDGFEYSGLIYEEPGSFEGVINVSATDKNDTIASYSNYGEHFIDIAAPGGDNCSFENMCISTSLANGYTFDFGTSLSAPKVSGAAALLICKDNLSEASQIEQKIYKNADIFNPDYNKYYGCGIIDIYKMLKY